MHTPVIDMEKIGDLPWYKYLYTAVPEERLTTKASFPSSQTRSAGGYNGNFEILRHFPPCEEGYYAISATGSLWIHRFVGRMSCAL